MKIEIVESEEGKVLAFRTYERPDLAPENAELVDPPEGFRIGDALEIVDGNLARVGKVLPYDELRRKEYPPIEDYLDGVVKGDQAQIDAYIAACLAVKAKFPRPE